METVKAYENAQKLKTIQKDLIRFEGLYVSIEDLSKIYNYFLQNLSCEEKDLNYEYFVQHLEL